MRVRYFGLAMILLLAPLATVARAQATTAVPDEEATITLGPLKIAPSLRLKSLGVDNNVFNESDTPKSDFTFTITPRADLIFQPGRARLTYTTATDYVYYQRFKSERGTNQLSAVGAEFDLGAFRPFASASGNSSRDRVSPEIDLRARHHENVYAAGTNLKFGTGMTAGVTLMHQAFSFDEGAIFRGQDLGRELNHDIDEVEGRFGMDVTSLTSIALVVDRDAYSFDLAPERDATSIRLVPTLYFKPAALLNGSFGIGYQTLRGRTSNLGDYTGVNMKGDLSMALAERYRLVFGAGRDVRFSYDALAPYYVLNSLNAALTTQLTSAWDVLTLARRDAMGYRLRASAANAGTDTEMTYGAGFGYRLRPQLRLGMQAEWLHRSSDRADTLEFGNRRIFSTLTWGAIR